MTILNPGYALQKIISQGTSDGLTSDGVEGPHHPISCHSQIAWYEDNSMTCVHAKAGPDCPRNQSVIDCTIAILIIELGVQKYGG